MTTHLPLTAISCRMIVSLSAVAAFGVLAGSAHANLIIDNFRASVGHTQVLIDNTNDSAAVQASYAATGNAVILGGQRDVSISLLGTGQLTASQTDVMFSNAGAQLGLGRYGASSQIEFVYSDLFFNAAAAGSNFTLHNITNHMATGSSGAFNTVEVAHAIGQKATLTLTDTNGQASSLQKSIPYWGTSLENGKFDVVFDFASLAAGNFGLNLASIQQISLRFDLLNVSGFSEVVYLGDGTSAFSVSGEAFPFNPPPPSNSVPDQGGWFLLPGALAIMLFARRFTRR